MATSPASPPASTASRPGWSALSAGSIWIALQAAEFLTPAVVGRFCHADRSNRVGDRLASRAMQFDLPELRNDLLSRMPFLGILASSK